MNPTFSAIFASALKCVLNKRLGLQSAASGTLLLTAANLANLAAIHPPTVTAPKQMDTASVASSTHFTVVNGLGRPTTVYRKSWCARNQLTVLVCTMSFLFMVGLLAGILYMESKYPQQQPPRARARAHELPSYCHICCCCCCSPRQRFRHRKRAHERTRTRSPRIHHPQASPVFTSDCSEGS